MNYAKSTTPQWGVRLSDEGRQAVRIACAYTGETRGQFLERLALAELARLEQARAEAAVGRK